MMRLIALAALCCAVLFPNLVAAQPLDRGMQRLCIKAEQRTFTPSSRTTSSDELLGVISRSADPVAIRVALGKSDPNARIGTTGTTGLIHAAASGNWVAVKTLLDAGADIDRRSAGDATALEMAILNNRLGIACKLIQHGAAVPGPQDGKQYLLPMAAVTEELEDAVIFIDFLIGHGYDVNAVLPTNQDTALLIAAEMGNEKLVKLLVEQGADLTHRNGKNETALMVARRAGQKRIAELLFRYESRIK